VFFEILKNQLKRFLEHSVSLCKSSWTSQDVV